MEENSDSESDESASEYDSEQNYSDSECDESASEHDSEENFHFDFESDESESELDSYQNLSDFELKPSQLISSGISQQQQKSSMPQMEQCTESDDSSEDDSIAEREVESSVVDDSNDFKDNIPSVVDHVLFLELPFRQHGTLKSWIADRANPLVCIVFIALVFTKFDGSNLSLGSFAVTSKVASEHEDIAGRIP